MDFHVHTSSQFSAQDCLAIKGHVGNCFPHPDLLFQKYPKKFLKSSICNLTMKSLVSATLTTLKNDWSSTPICQSSLSRLPPKMSQPQQAREALEFCLFSYLCPQHQKHTHLYQHISEDNNKQEVYSCSQTQHI